MDNGSWLPDFSVSTEPERVIAVNYSVTLGSFGEIRRFDARRNLSDVLRTLDPSVPPSNSLKKAAAAALRRQTAATISPEEWAERLSHDFFRDLDD